MNVRHTFLAVVVGTSVPLMFKFILPFYVYTGRELAAELSSTVQPLQHVASIPAQKMTAFLQQSLISHEE